MQFWGRHGGHLSFLKEAASPCCTRSPLLVHQLGLEWLHVNDFWVTSIITNVRILFLQSNCVLSKVFNADDVRSAGTWNIKTPLCSTWNTLVDSIKYYSFLQTTCSRARFLWNTFQYLLWKLILRLLCKIKMPLLFETCWRKTRIKPNGL